MKKIVLVLLCLIFIHGRIMASENELIPLNIEVEVIDEEPSMSGHSKAPLRMPRIYQNGYKLTLSGSHPEYIINIVQDDELVYTSVIPAGVTEFELPSYLNGECIIQFISGRFCFHGQIKL